MKKNAKNKFKKITITLIPIIVFLLIGWLLILGVKSYIDNAAYFKIKKVVLNGLEDNKTAQDISRQFLYDNIFSLDLKKIKEDLKIANPQFYDAEVIRNFPDQLTINVIVRRPVAQIKQKGFFLVDSEGVIVSDKSKKPFKGSLIISGLKSISDLSFGKKINLEKLKSGLRLVRALKNINQELISLIPELTSDKIKIDISKHPSLYVYCNTLELRFYDDNLIKGIKSLKKILPTLNEEIGRVRYIDLRFAEPAVSFKR
ncbi:MAG: FtsQ-type POTRA domain-containing protein [Candidatus Omnitrophica bacterium]|nr:FtsQ-type POTRA domain-containing protein [Candidatus Omnitrophota bacterium]